jgi:hypothetical protein
LPQIWASFGQRIGFCFTNTHFLENLPACFFVLGY